MKKKQLTKNKASKKKPAPYGNNRKKKGTKNQPRKNEDIDDDTNSQMDWPWPDDYSGEPFGT